MVNADEHKKLLAQVAELEKNSVNYFNVEKEFFLIDSDNLPQVRPWLNDFIDRQDIRSMDFDSDNPSRVRSRLYGYSIQRTGIYEEDNLTAETIAGLDGRGCYVYVEVKDGNIMIKQDLNGSWGIYLFRHGNYFALSNSFFRLVDHVKFKYPLTVNRDYCHHLLTNSLVSHAYLESAINEIRLVERNAIIHIDIGKKKLEIELINYREHTVPLDSEEGISTLDRWAEFWGDVLRGVAQNTNFLQAHLSGGFDTRMALVSLLHSGIDLSKIINERFPRRMIKDKADKGVFHLQPKDLQAEKIIAAGKNNPSISMDLTRTCFKAMFDSSRTYGLFTAYFDEELYRYATVHIDYIIGVIGVTRVLEDVEISQRNHSPYQDLKRFLEQDFAKIHKVSRTPDKFQPYLTARVDIQLMSTTGDFEIFSVSDDKAKVSKPSWFQKNGIGYQLNSYAGELDFTAKATTDGQIKLWLRGVWVPDPKDKSKLIPYWIDYTKLTVNGETIFDTITPAWCNKPYSYNFKAKTNEEIKIQVEWLPHRSDT